MDVAIVGSGLIGLSCARELGAAGLEVRVIDDGSPPASRAAAGILGPQSEANGPSPAVELGLRSLELWPKFVEGLGEVGFRLCGTLHVPFDEAHARELEENARWQLSAGFRVERRGDGWFFPAEGTVDNRRLVDALAARTRLVRGRVRAVAADRVELQSGETLRARHVVLCAGAWSGQIAPLDVFPVRGQMLALAAPPPPSVIFGRQCYVVPRPDRILVGATMERVGFDVGTTAEARAYLLSVAARLCPGAERAAVLEHWAGLRPGTGDELPHIGRLANGAIAATGHYRNGILLAPITARIVRSLVLGETPPLDLVRFDPSRRIR
jgi:glycine oxidase